MIDMLEVKVHKMYRLDGNRPLKAFADISLNDAVLIKGIKVILGKEGLFVSMPQEQGKDNKWYESVRCLKKDIREQISETVLNAYQAQTG
ncbi:MAG: septation protein SpoVG family protein [Candidatus Omnitrophota bacterium]